MFNKLIGGYKEKNISNREKRERDKRGEAHNTNGRRCLNGLSFLAPASSRNGNHTHHFCLLVFISGVFGIASHTRGIGMALRRIREG